MPRIPRLEQIIQHCEDAFLDLTCVFCAADQHELLGEVDHHAASEFVPSSSSGFESGGMQHGKGWAKAARLASSLGWRNIPREDVVPGSSLMTRTASCCSSSAPASNLDEEVFPLEVG